jgi:hypothetical protein
MTILEALATRFTYDLPLKLVVFHTVNGIGSLRIAMAFELRTGTG